MTSTLLSPVTINKTEIRNRTVMPPMLTNFATRGGDVTERHMGYYSERARGGLGIVTVEGTAVEPRGVPFIRGISAADDSRIKGLARLASVIKAQGARASFQLIHGGRCINPAISGFATPMVSYVPQFCNYAESVLLDEEDIAATVQAYGKVAARAREAGFDMVEIHGAHGYLVHQFTSPLTNKRTDKYGGDALARLTMPMEVVRAMRKAVGEDFPIIYRHSAYDGLPGGLSLEETLLMMPHLVDAGVDALHITVGLGETKHLMSPPSCFEEGWSADVAAKVKQAIGSRVPVISVGRYVHPERADEVIRQGKADLVAFGRAVIAEPDLINKYKNKTMASARLGLACTEACTGHTGKLLDITCAINPRAGLEGKYPLDAKAAASKKVAVVGAGPAGLQAALTAAQRGHKVTLFEAANHLGGLLIPASKPPFKSALAELAQYFEHQLADLGVDVRLNTKVSAATLKAGAFDHILLATGSAPVEPPFMAQIPGAVFAEDVLMGRAVAGKRVLIVGGGMIGCECADFLGQAGHEVTVLEMLPQLCADMEWRARRTIMERLEKYQVIQRPGTQLLEAGPAGVKIRTPHGAEKTLPAFDTVIIAVGYRSVPDLARELELEDIPFVCIGDAVKAARIMDAMRQGLEAAWAL